MSKQPPIDRAFFREAEDGATVFFPWGLAHRGYKLSDPDAKAKASRAGSILIASTIAIGTWTAYALQPLLESDAHGPTEVLGVLAAPGAALFLVLLFYWFWASRFVERLPESNLQVSRDQRLREAAELVGPRKVALIGLGIAGSSAFLIWLQPNAWWLGLLGMALGMGLLGWSLLMKRAAAGPLR